MGRIGYTALRRRMIVCTVPIFKVGDAAPSGDVERHEWHTRDPGERLPVRAPRHPRTTVVRSSGRAARPPAGVATERR